MPDLSPPGKRGGDQFSAMWPPEGVLALCIRSPPTAVFGAPRGCAGPTGWSVCRRGPCSGSCPCSLVFVFVLVLVLVLVLVPVPVPVPVLVLVRPRAQASAAAAAAAVP